MKKKENNIRFSAHTALAAVKRYLCGLDLPILAAVLALCAFGVVLLYSVNANGIIGSVSSRTWITQLAAVLMGLTAALVLAGIDYRRLVGRFWIFAVPAVLLTVLTYTPLGIQREGSDDKAWLNLGFMSFQPSEILKFAFLLSFAFHVRKVRKEINKPKNIFYLVLHGLTPVILVACQGDYGTALVFAFMFAVILSVSGVSIKFIIACAVAVPLMGLGAWFFLLEDSHKQRLLIIFNPDSDPLGAGYQQRLGKIALSGGGLFGKGLFGGEYTYVPEVHNDFIFSYIGQALGFVGCVATVIALTFLCVKIFMLSLKIKSSSGRIICVGAGTLFFTHCFMNIGMVLGFMPVVGIPLPFLSAGGTAVVGMLTVLGLVLSVSAHREKEKKLFYDDEG